MAQNLVVRRPRRRGGRGGGRDGRREGETKLTYPLACCVDIGNLNVGKRRTEFSRVQFVVRAFGGQDLVLFLDLREKGRGGGGQGGKREGSVEGRGKLMVACMCIAPWTQGQRVDDTFSSAKRCRRGRRGGKEEKRGGGRRTVKFSQV